MPCCRAQSPKGTKPLGNFTGSGSQKPVVLRKAAGLVEWPGLGFDPPTVACVHPANVGLDSRIKESLEPGNLRFVEGCLLMPNGPLPAAFGMRHDLLPIPAAPQVLRDFPVATLPEHHCRRRKPHLLAGLEPELRPFLPGPPTHTAVLRAESGRPFPGPAQDQDPAFIAGAGQVEIRPTVATVGSICHWAAD